jgi:hypothetical protein
MTIAALNRKVKLWVKRKVPLSIGKWGIFKLDSNSYNLQSIQENNPYPYTITLFRNGNDSFGFVIISTLNRVGPSIGNFLFSSN